jgi:hypothetical protein
MIGVDRPLSRREQGRLNSLKAIAYHEAGHAVIAMVEGRRFIRISIIPADGVLGRVRFAPLPRWFKPDGVIDGRHRLFIEREVLIDLAGDAALLRFKGRRDWRGSRSDIESAVGLAMRLFCGRVLDSYMVFMRDLAMEMVAMPKNWTQIEALAATLLAEKELSEDRAHEVCMEALLRFGGLLP